MNKVFTIIKREYLSRVTKKSFIIVTLLIPLLMAVVMLAPMLIARWQSGETRIAVLDESGLFENKLQNTSHLTFVNVDGELDFWKTEHPQKGFDGVLYIPSFDLENPQGIACFSETQLGIGSLETIEHKLETEIENLRYNQAGLDKALIEKLQAHISLTTIVLSDEGEKSQHPAFAIIVGQVSGFILYFVLLFYGTAIMRGVLEEKKNRIVEIVISCIKPFQLMLGKVIGIGAVALTQLLIWLILIIVIASGVSHYFLGEVLNTAPNSPQFEELMQNSQTAQAQEIFEGLNSLNLPLIIFSFIFFFLGGYLLYSALFAAVGTLVGEAGENQNLSFPVTLPIILSIFIMVHVMQQPNSPLAFWGSIIPLFSPIVMMARLPFGIPLWQLGLSMALLILGFAFTIWLAGKIYRVGILMYGKKVTIKELGKWLVYKE